MLIVFSALTPLKVFAYDEGFFAANDILFYNPDDCGGDTSGGSGNSSVVAIGDSLLANDQQAGKLEEKLKANKYTDVTIDAQSSRFIDGGSVPSGLEAIDTNKAKITATGTIIVVLGTNYPGSRSTFDNNVKKFMTNIRALNKDARVFWVNIVNAGDTASANGANSVIEDADNIKTYNYSVVDWHKAVYANGQADTSLLSMGDGGYHQSSPKGINKHVSLILDAVGEYTAPSSGGSGTDKNLETILRYLTGKGLSLAAAAGIAGNIKVESASTFNPAIIQGGGFATASYTPVDGVGFGLAQWTFSSRQGPLVAMAKAEHKSIIDLDLQMDYMWHEMTDMTLMLKRLNAIKSTSKYGSASAPMAAAIIFHGRTDLIMSTATKEITDVNPPYGFEASAENGPGVVNHRGKPAESIYKTYKGKIQDGTGVAGVSTDPTDIPNASSDCTSKAPTNGEGAGPNGWSSSAMVYYAQCDPKWASKPYGSVSSICEGGCGLTSTTMILATLTGDKSITPDKMAIKYASFHVAGGTNHALFPKAASDYGLKDKDLGMNFDEVRSILKKGGLIIMGANAGYFTSGGHLMVIRAMTDDESKFYVADPAQPNSSYSATLGSREGPFTPEFLTGQGNVATLWGIWK